MSPSSIAVKSCNEERAAPVSVGPAIQVGLIDHELGVAALALDEVPRGPLRDRLRQRVGGQPRRRRIGPVALVVVADRLRRVADRRERGGEHDPRHAGGDARRAGRGACRRGPARRPRPDPAAGSSARRRGTPRRRRRPRRPSRPSSVRLATTTSRPSSSAPPPTDGRAQPCSLPGERTVARTGVPPQQQVGDEPRAEVAGSAGDEGGHRHRRLEARAASCSTRRAASASAAASPRSRASQSAAFACR